MDMDHWASPIQNFDAGIFQQNPFRLYTQLILTLMVTRSYLFSASCFCSEKLNLSYLFLRKSIISENTEVEVSMKVFLFMKDIASYPITIHLE